MKKTIFVVGNRESEDDNIPLLLQKDLSKKFPDIRFLHHDPTENLETEKSDRLILIDTVEGLKKVRVFYNIDDFQLSPRNSVHDYDLLLNLRLLIKIGKIKKFIIIGVPQKAPLKKIRADLFEAISSI